MSCNETSWVQRGVEAFSRGQFENGGANLYVNATGEIETIHRSGLLNNGHVDIILANTHGYIERGPTWIYKMRDALKHPRQKPGKWTRRELPNDSGWMSRVADVDGDGHPDLIVANGENGVTSELDSYVYWGGPNGLTGQRTELPTTGAYDVAAADINGDGRLDLIFTSAWRDHHNRGQPMPLRVYLQTRPRHFEDASERYGLIGIGACSVACADLRGIGRTDLVVANYRSAFEYVTDSFVYWGTDDGFDAGAPTRLPSHYALQVLLADLDGDGREEIIFAGGNQVWVYWNDGGRFGTHRRTIIEIEGSTSQFIFGGIRVDVADVDGDGRNELIAATEQGVEIRGCDDLHAVRQRLSLLHASWVHAADLDGDGRPDLIVSKYHGPINYEAESAVFWNGPEGFSADRVSRLETAGAQGCTAGDLDGDGRPQIIFNNTMRGPSQFWDDLPLYIYFGSKEADYGVHRRRELPTGQGTIGYIMADLNLDGYPDLVTTRNGGLRLFPGGPRGPQPDRYLDLEGPGSAEGHIMQTHEVHVADFNRDGYLDLFAVGRTHDDKPETMARSSVIFLGSSDGFSSDRCQVLPTYCSGKAHVADLTGDGYLDIAVGDRRGHITIFRGGPEGYSPDRTLKLPTGIDLCGGFTSADLTGNGYLDLIVGIASHYERRPETVFIFYGGPEGYSATNVQKYLGGYTSPGVSVADIDRDGRLELIVAAYSTAQARVLPMQIFRIERGRVDFDHPVDLWAESSCASMALDLDGNGYRDLIVICHRNDYGHQVDSLILWNGPQGLSLDRVTRLPGLGPHALTPHPPGNAFTREPMESYISPPKELNGRTPVRIVWDADVPAGTALKFQLRRAASRKGLAEAAWRGPGGSRTYYEQSGQIEGVDDAAQWLQYRAVFVSPNGALSPKLREVRIEFH